MLALLMAGALFGAESTARAQDPPARPRASSLPDALPPLAGSPTAAGTTPAQAPGTTSVPRTTNQPDAPSGRTGGTEPGAGPSGSTSGGGGGGSGAGGGGTGAGNNGGATDPTGNPAAPGGGPLGDANSPGTGGSNTTSAAVNAPTTAEAAGAGGNQTNYLERLLKTQNSPIRTYGWIENSFTGNTNGRPRNDQNGTVFPNRLADQWQGNQYYLILEKVLKQNDSINFGGRFDTLFGNDWQFTKSYGLFDREFKPNSFAGVDLPQIYGEVHLPILTKNGLDIRGGRFYSPAGFENVQAVKRPLLSVPYIFDYTPFTLFGVLSTLHVNERTNFYLGAVNGWDRWIDQNYRYSALTGFSYNSRDLKTSVTSILLTGPDQLPRFPPANSPFLPTGVPPAPPGLPGQPNLNYAGNWRTFQSTVLTHTWSDRLTEAFEIDWVHETNVIGPNGHRNPESAWYGAAHWYLYNFTPKLQGVWRAEVFRDQNGFAVGRADNYYEMTLGLPYKPKPWLWIRPEARYDWAQYHRPYNDGTRGSQLTLAFDIIVQF